LLPSVNHLGYPHVNWVAWVRLMWDWIGRTKPFHLR